MEKGNKILIVQTAFPGDVILTLPLVQILKKNIPVSEIDFLCIPQTSVLLDNNPYVNEVIIYDKKNSGIRELLKLGKYLKAKHYDILISPHRSYRSSLLGYISSAKKTIAFDKSSGSFLYNNTVQYRQNIHEIQRNLALLDPLGIKEDKIIRPELFPGEDEIKRVDDFFLANSLNPKVKIISIAPGSVWFTKRFPKEKFVILCNLLQKTDWKVILIGGGTDTSISAYIKDNSMNKNIIDSTGCFSLPGSSEIIRRSTLLITNDSAPLHIANAVGTTVIAIFGATVPAFGFFPYGKHDIIFETNGLSCRPCSIHGGDKCPIGTFVCMKNIKEENILDSVTGLLSQAFN